MKSHGTGKSAVSRSFVKGTKKKMNTFLKRDLSGVKPVIIMIDGVHFSEHVILVALGIDAQGKKIVLGIQEGATENSVSCKCLLRDIVSRGVSQEPSTLFVLDGAKALLSADNPPYALDLNNDFSLNVSKMWARRRYFSCGSDPVYQ